MSNWFEVDHEGLAKIMARRGKEFIVYELLSNAWDEPGVTEVNVLLAYHGHGHVSLTVTDDAPDGFKDLAHAYTLFASSGKKTNPKQRGRFNAGEKMVLAMCYEAQIATTTGAFLFDRKGRHRRPSLKRHRGSEIRCSLDWSREDYDAVCQALTRLIAPPSEIRTTFNGVVLERRPTVWSFGTRLTTELASEDGVLHRTQRFTDVDVYPVYPGETAYLYELGIPVCETDDKYHVDINQKIPLTLDRESVLPSFLKQVRVEVFNRTAAMLNQDDVNKPWVAQAMESPEADRQAVTQYVQKRFGEKSVAFDPSDIEGTHIAVAEGYTVVTGSMLSKDAWANVKAAGLVRPAGQVTPSPKPYSPDGEPLTLIDPDKRMQAVAEYAQRVAKMVLGKSIAVQFALERKWPVLATFGPSGILVFNCAHLPTSNWFDLETNREAIDELLIHELAHHYSGNHLSADYHQALCRIAAKMLALARKNILI